MELSIKTFVNLRKSLSPLQLIKVEVLGRTFAGEFEDVYNMIRDLSSEISLTQDVKVIYTKLNSDLSKKVFAWQDEIPGLLESFRLYYENLEDDDEKLKMWSRIKELYAEVYEDIENRLIELDKYLSGLIEQPDISDIEDKVIILNLLTHPELLKTKWLDAVSSGNINLVKLLLWNGQDIDELEYISPPVYHDCDRRIVGNASSIAIKYSRVDILKLLLNRGCDLLLVTDGFTQSITYAMNNCPNSYDIVETLMQHKVDPNYSMLETTFLHVACSNHNEKVVKLLLDYHANPNIRDFSGNYPMEIAIIKGHIKIVKMLITAGADLNLANYSNDTYLHIACYYDQINIVKLLLKHKANSNMKNMMGQTPIDIALLNKFSNIITLLIT